MSRSVRAGHDRSRYEISGVRYESRPDPVWAAPRLPAAIERAYGVVGVRARCISVVEPWGTPYYRSHWLPTTFTTIGEQEAQLKHRISLARRSGVVVLSWYPLSLNKAAVQAHPDWAQQMLVDTAN